MTFSSTRNTSKTGRDCIADDLVALSKRRHVLITAAAARVEFGAALFHVCLQTRSMVFADGDGAPLTVRLVWSGQSK